MKWENQERIGFLAGKKKKTKIFQAGGNDQLMLLKQYEDVVIDISRKYVLGFLEFLVGTTHFLAFN